ncbi:alpha/beta hydrolase [Leifsonia poae]|uniref:alpha/beta hydrolase n=1 Tax=Leifsonia poae TaxID=110933 RepID=UPI003D66AD1C
MLPADIPPPAAYSTVGDAPTGNEGSLAVSGSILGSLSRLNASDLPAYVQSHRTDLDRMLANPPKAGDVSGVWRLLDPVKQAALLEAAPHVIGNLEGVPYSVRGRANLLDLKRTIADTDRKIKTGTGRAVRIELEQKRETLENVQKALKQKNGVKRTLVSLDTASDARASIVIGDLATAKYVSVLVPGMYMSVGEQIVDWSKTAQNLYDQQTSMLHRVLGPRGGQGPPASPRSRGSDTRRRCS